MQYKDECLKKVNELNTIERLTRPHAMYVLHRNYGLCKLTIGGVDISDLMTAKDMNVFLCGFRKGHAYGYDYKAGEANDVTS